MYSCPFCNKRLVVTEQYVEVCQCPESIREDQAYRERVKQLASKQKITFAEARDKNKRPIRKKG